MPTFTDVVLNSEGELQGEITPVMKSKLTITSESKDKSIELKKSGERDKEDLQEKCHKLNDTQIDMTNIDILSR